MLGVLTHNVGYHVGCNGQELWEACQDNVKYPGPRLSAPSSQSLLVTVYSQHNNTLGSVCLSQSEAGVWEDGQ